MHSAFQWIVVFGLLAHPAHAESDKSQSRECRSLKLRFDTQVANVDRSCTKDEDCDMIGPVWDGPASIKSPFSANRHKFATEHAGLDALHMQAYRACGMLVPPATPPPRRIPFCWKNKCNSQPFYISDLKPDCQSISKRFEAQIAELDTGCDKDKDCTILPTWLGCGEMPSSANKHDNRRQAAEALRRQADQAQCIAALPCPVIPAYPLCQDHRCNARPGFSPSLNLPPEPLKQ